MTSTYDPHDPGYVDEAGTRNELTRVFDVCSGCRRCVDRCGSFPLLFALVDRRQEREAGWLTPAQQDAVVDECFQCGRCVLDCPYAPGRDDAAVDVPGLLLRAVAMRRANQHLTVRRGVTGLVGASGRLGRLAAAVPSLGNAVVGAAPGSLVRTALRAVTGASAVRLLPPYARRRFSRWWARRPRVRLTDPQGSVAVVPTCLVEHHAPGIGQDLVKVYERNGIECRVAADIACCGAPLLRRGDVDGFTRLARANVDVLAVAVGEGLDVVVAQPTCSLAVRHDYPTYVPGPSTDAVVARTFDACEYLMRLHRGESTVLDTTFVGDVPATITYHVACHLRAQEIGLAGRDVLRLTGARIELAQGCSGANALWGLPGMSEDAADGLGAALAGEIGAGAVAVVAGDCHLANTAIGERTGITARHPLEVLARAYGIAVEP